MAKYCDFTILFQSIYRTYILYTPKQKTVLKVLLYEVLTVKKKRTFFVS